MIRQVEHSGNAPIIPRSMHEAEAIPFTASQLRGERLLVLAPHPDDEVIGCGGLLAQHTREGRKVRAVVATDGTEAIASADRADYGRRREEECSRGLAVVGIADVDFLRFPDRHLEARGGELRDRLREALQSFHPDLILVPSPIEIHPDHLALASEFCTLIQSDEALFAELAVAQIAFYEVSQPLRPNTLVDITDVAGVKWEAIAAHASQLEIRDYVAFARGLNAFRSMTLPSSVQYAEAYYTLPLASLRTQPFSALQHAVGDARGALSVEREPLPISVIVRTKDRPALLREALQSIRATGYPAEVLVVNDGGATPDCGTGVKLVQHESPRGRSRAMNSGVEAAANPFIAFLDDDDIYYPPHLDVLSRAAVASPVAACYADAVSAFVHIGESGTMETTARLRLFGDDYDRDLLLIDNYIPLPTLLVRRDDFLALGGFDPQFDLFEDWDFLIRLSGRGTFVHVPRITCEIRHVQAGTSITLAAPEGSTAFREAKLKVWRKHQTLLDPNVFANAFERQKDRLGTANSDVVEQRGRAHHLEISVERFERDKADLLAKLQALHEDAVRNVTRMRELEGFQGGAQAALDRAAHEISEKSVALARLEEEHAAATAGRRDMQTTIQALYAEIRRLQSMLDMIYASRTWKLHNMIEKVRSRG